MPGCGQCGESVDVVAGQVGRRDLCTRCGAELRSCMSCRHYDPNVAKGCREPFAEVPRDRAAANFCELFQIGEGRAGNSSGSDSLSAAEALFRKR